MPDQDMRLNVEVPGADKAAADLGKVEKAQTGITDTAKTGEKGTEDLTDAQVQLNAAEGDYVSLVGVANPVLAIYVDKLLKFVKVADAATKGNTGLAEVLAKVNTGLKANAEILKLVGAGAAAALAIWAVVRAYRQLTEEAKKAADAMRDANKAADDSRSKHELAAEAIRDEANQRERIPPTTIQQAEAMQREAEAIVRRHPTVEPETAAKIQTQFGGVEGITPAQREAATLVAAGGGEIPFDKRADALSLQVRMEQGLESEQNQRRLENERIQSRTKRRREAQDLQSRILSGGLSDEDLRQITTNEKELERLKENLRLFPTKEDLEAGKRRAGGLKLGEDTTLIGEDPQSFTGYNVQQVGPREMELWRQAIERNTDVIRQRNQPAAPAGMVINMGVDAASRERRSTNSGTAVDRAEGAP